MKVKRYSVAFITLAACNALIACGSSMNTDKNKQKSQQGIVILASPTSDAEIVLSNSPTICDEAKTLVFHKNEIFTNINFKIIDANADDTYAFTTGSYQLVSDSAFDDGLQLSSKITAVDNITIDPTCTPQLQPFLSSGQVSIDSIGADTVSGSYVGDAAGGHVEEHFTVTVCNLPLSDPNSPPVVKCN